MVIGGSFPGVKWLDREALYSPPSSAYVKNVWSHAPIRPYVFVSWCLIKHRID